MANKRKAGRTLAVVKAHSRLAELVAEAGSNAAFAALCGVHDRRVTDWTMTRYGRLPNAENLFLIAEATGCSVDWLLGLSEQRYRRQVRTSPELGQDVAAYLCRRVAQAERIATGHLIADGNRALEEMAEREVHTFKAERKWSAMFAAVITRKLMMKKRGSRPSVGSPEWEELRRETFEALTMGEEGTMRRPSSNVSIGYAPEV